jgi:hypothetical protein
MTKTVRAAGEAFAALAALPELRASRSWSADADALAALPVAASGTATDRTRLVALAWIAIRALSATMGGEPGRAFDTLRLRRGVHDVLARATRGVADEDLWRAAARVHSLLLTAGTWAPGAKGTDAAPWRDDADAAWLIGAHDSGGVRWFRQEDHARFTWWSTLPALLGRAADRPDAPVIAEIETWVAERLAEAKASAWRFEALLASRKPEAEPVAAPAPTPLAPALAPLAPVAPPAKS